MPARSRRRPGLRGDGNDEGAPEWAPPGVCGSGRPLPVPPRLHHVRVREEAAGAVVGDARVPEIRPGVRAVVDLILLLRQQHLDLLDRALALALIQLAPLLVQELVELRVVHVTQVDAGAAA